jgi:hypothetical protein
MLRFHNAVVADVTADLGPGFTVEEIFAEAQRIVRCCTSSCRTPSGSR